MRGTSSSFKNAYYYGRLRILRGGFLIGIIYFSAIAILATLYKPSVLTTPEFVLGSLVALLLSLSAFTVLFSFLVPQALSLASDGFVLFVGPNAKPVRYAWSQLRSLTVEDFSHERGVSRVSFTLMSGKTSRAYFLSIGLARRLEEAWRRRRIA